MSLKKHGNIDLKGRLRKMSMVKQNAMRAIANNSVNFFKITVFNAQGWIDRSVQKWAPRKPTAKRNSRKILVDTGAGRQSITAVIVTAEKVVIRAEATYMKFHNDGTGKLPQRKFMGKSETLDSQNTSILKRFLRQLMQ